MTLKGKPWPVPRWLHLVALRIPVSVYKKRRSKSLQVRREMNRGRGLANAPLVAGNCDNHCALPLRMLTRLQICTGRLLHVQKCFNNNWFDTHSVSVSLERGLPKQ